jgi:AAA domain
VSRPTADAIVPLGPQPLAPPSLPEILQRLEQFNSRPPIAHPNLVAAHDRSLTHILTSKRKVLAIVGPPGVGKDTLIRGIRRALDRHRGDDSKRDPYRFTDIYVELAATDSVKYNEKLLWVNILEAGDDILVDKHWSPDERGFTPSAGKRLLAGTGGRLPSANELRRAVENLLLQRQPLALLLNEAQHLLVLPGGRTPQQQFDLVKSLANRAEVVIVLVGTYRLLDILDSSADLPENGQLMRRLDWVHLGRYGYTKNDRATFRGVLAAFEERLPFSQPSNLESHADFIHDGSAGSVGIVHDWIERALRLVPSGASHLDVAHLEASRILGVNRIDEDAKRGVRLWETFTGNSPPRQQSPPSRRSAVGKLNPER